MTDPNRPADPLAIHRNWKDDLSIVIDQMAAVLKKLTAKSNLSETAEYCRLLGELPPGHRRAYLGAAQPDSVPQKAFGNGTPRDDAQMREARRLLKLESEIPSRQKSTIEQAFLNDHPEDKRAHDALQDAYRQAPVGERPPRMKDLFDDTLRIRRQIRRDCGPEPG